ncbi:bactofilin family protein [Salinarchaeum laminariae]|uniref:bactofilin family protein n=1 Tax=Salinarchaeum laminariae TaxID=869888 RepID=UPI0020C0889E|nr:polymer-forming cytoskeletal protein [Salinarchaeum laminariae]
MNRRVAYLGLAFVLCGAALLATPTFGFETIAADRSAQIETTNDANALVGFEATDESINSLGDTATVFTLRNNAEESLTFSVETEIDDAGNVEVDTPGDGEVAAGQTTDVVLRCNGDSGTGTTTVTTTVTEAAGESITITGASSSTTIDYQCTDSGGGGPPGSGPASFAANDPQYDGGQWTQQFEINIADLKNKGGFTIDLSDAQANAGVDYSGASATITSGQGSRDFEFDKNEWTITYTSQGKTDGPFVIEVSGIEITSDQDGGASFSTTTGESGTDAFAVPAIGNDGNTQTDGDLVVEDGTSANGDIDAGGTVTIGNGATANDDVNAGGDVTVGNSGTVHGDLESGGDVSLGDGATASNDVAADGDVSIGADGTAHGNIEAGGDVTIGPSGTASGEVSAGGSVTVGTGATVHGEIEAGGTVTAEADSTLSNGVSTDGDVYLADGVTAWGEIESGGTVYVGCDVSYTEDNVDAEGGVVSTCEN